MIYDQLVGVKDNTGHILLLCKGVQRTHPRCEIPNDSESVLELWHAFRGMDNGSRAQRGVT
jgi:hypothetical protein